MTYWLGLDIGTGGSRALLVRADGSVACGVTAPHEDILMHRPLWAEQRPENWWDAATLAIREVLATASASGHDVAGIGLSGQMHGLTLLDQVSKVDPNIRSVIVSAYGDMKNIRTAMNRGAFDFITKPIDFDDLRITIDRTLVHMAVWRDALESRDQLVAIRNELGIASQMQQSILPKVFPRGAGYETFANMEPARDVGGDFFDFVRLHGNRVGIAIADVSGKGVPAALFMMSSRTLLKGSAIGVEEPDLVLTSVNGLLEEDNESLMFVTVFYAVFDPQTGAFTYANGGHNPPLLVRADGTSEYLPTTDGVALGVMPDYDFEQRTVALAPGELVVLFTDGVTEAINDEDEEFGPDRLQEVFSGGPPGFVREANEAVFGAVNEFAGDAPQFDDITCVTLMRAEDGS